MCSSIGNRTRTPYFWLWTIEHQTSNIVRPITNGWNRATKYLKRNLTMGQNQVLITYAFVYKNNLLFQPINNKVANIHRFSEKKIALCSYIITLEDVVRWCSSFWEITTITFQQVDDWYYTQSWKLFPAAIMLQLCEKKLWWRFGGAAESVLFFLGNASLIFFSFFLLHNFITVMY